MIIARRGFPAGFLVLGKPFEDKARPVQEYEDQDLSPSLLVQDLSPSLLVHRLGWQLYLPFALKSEKVSVASTARRPAKRPQAVRSTLPCPRPDDIATRPAHPQHHNNMAIGVNTIRRRARGGTHCYGVEEKEKRKR